jgi:hypothetical protein
MESTWPDSDAQPEIPLTGGRLTDGVVRVGNTVRRPTGLHSPFVHGLLSHLEAESYGLQDTSGLLDAVLRRQEENLAETLVRTRAQDASVVQYAQDAAAWQRRQIAWLCANAGAFRSALDA